MGNNPIDFIDSANWRDFKHIAEIEVALREIGFVQTSEIARAPEIGLLCQGWRHGGHPFCAIIFESDEHGCWYEIYANSQTADYYIATASPIELEWAESKKTIEMISNASVQDLFAALSAMTDRLPLEHVDEVMFAIHLHDRLYQHWKFVHEISPEELGRLDEGQRRRLKTWMDDFVRFFRPLGFFAPASDLNDSDFSRLVLDYEEPLFDLLPGTADLCDDYDEVDDFFSADQLQAMPTSDQQMDIQMLAILDPDRVRWNFRVENYEQVWKSSDIQKRCKAEGLSAFEYTAPKGGNGLFSCGYTVLVPTSCLKVLMQDRNWVV